ncbi:MAG TPA: signal peptidase I [Gammaproteobacteria bacterium]|nr:signal peptidase I [Gammaproteobacteria bacterium]
MSEQTPRAGRRWYRSDWFVIPCMLLMLLAARSSLADHYHVPSGSMEYTIMTGDRVLIDKTAYGINIPFTHVEIVARGVPARGDVSVFDSPADGTRLIKRIVAVAGDTVSLRNGLLSVNGERLTADAAATRRVVEIFGEHRAELNLDSGGGPGVDSLIIPRGKVLALGDHRGNSLDSRYFGLVDVEQVYGRALGIYYRRGAGLTWRRL